ncbi:uncharacterized protein BKCO1_40002 [Diplodia corticola]|uniref:Uncharacterized protein n=1 Tax=Diplodia corticola TaxID=236234 RepID=A0A1J9S143_9PEZI|nr:uncharacterized protein BKCO1_40002 [Diplodia corticola]OJD38667.1 hypothetical protein BKCO1_40002 [Diplodia corticola]
MKFVQLVGAAGLAGAVALPAAAPDLDPDMLNALFAAPTPATLGPEPDAYSSTAPAFNPTTVAAVVQATVTDDDTASATATATATAAATDSTVAKRDLTAAEAKCAENGWDCCPLPTGTLDLPSPNTADAFTSFSTYSDLATGATAPSGYTQAFSNQDGAVQQVGYRGVYTLDSYSPSDCAAYCDADSSCQAFNIYIERDPSIRPDYDVCTNPDATANVKCTLYGYPVAAETATNTGQYQGDFQVVVAASNGYNKPYTAPTLDNFNAPVGPLGGAIEDSNYYLYELYNDGPFSPAACAAGCQANTAYNKAHPNSDGTYNACNIFNAYILYRDNNPVGTVCSYFTKDISDPAAEATNVGQYQGDVHVTIGESYTYTLTTQDNGGVVAEAGTGCSNPNVCGTYVTYYDPNGFDDQALCGYDPEGNSVCVRNGLCGTTTCSTNAECGDGKLCLAQSCCGQNICIDASTYCPNAVQATKRALENAAGMKMRGGPSSRRRSSSSDSCTALSCPSGADSSS